MRNRSILQILAIAFAVCLANLGMSASAAAQSECSSSVGTTYVLPLDGGLYNFQMNEWNSTVNECVDISGLGFTYTTANFDLATDGAPATYTSLYRGCHWGTCTSSNPFPIEESNIASATTSVSITQPSGYNNDAAYDIWFNQTSTTSGQPNGTEVMIWINHQGVIQPAGSDAATATIDGASWNVWEGTGSGTVSWNIVSYVATSPVTSVTNLNLLPFFADAVSRGKLQTSWWLIDVEYGFEIWTGGDGLAMSGYAVSAAAGTGGTCSTVPSAPSGLTATAASSSVINLSWTADTAPANCTISSYNVYSSTTANFTPSSSNLLASGVTATSYSNTGLAASSTHYYAVEAVDAEGASAASTEASAETSAATTASFTLSSSASTLSVTQGSSATDTISVTDVGGFTGSVTLAASGLPTGVTAAFATNPTTSTSVLTLTASSTATVGNSTVTITGTSGSLTATTSIALTVSAAPTGSFTLSVSGTATVAQGGSTTLTITVTDVSPFDGSVQLSYPASSGGITISGCTSPITGNGSCVLTITASSTATVGTTAFIVTGTGGTITATTTISITVTAAATGSFSLKPSATALSIAQGASGTDTITITDVSPFSGSVTLAASGLPTGVTATFGTNPATSTSVLTLAVASTAAAATSTITISGVSGSLSASTTIALTVTAVSSGTKCTVDYTIQPQNSSQFGAAITIDNTGTTAWTSWTLTWTFANGQTVSQLWNGVETQSGANVTVTNESYNGSVAAGGNVSGIGFNGTWNGTTNAVPTAFSINGTACTVN